MSHKPIAKCECVDCGLYPIMTSAAITIYVVNQDFYGISRCIHCERIVIDEMTKKTAVDLFWHNVIVLNWNDGTQIFDQKVLEKI